MKSDFQKVEDHFLKKVRQAGITLSPEELRDFAKEKGLKVSRKELESFRLSSRATSVFTKFSKPKAFISSSILKPGTIWVDFAHFEKFKNKEGNLVSWKRFNSGYKGFIAAADPLSGKIAAVPVKSKSRREWGRAVKVILEEHFPEARAIISDRDSAVTTDEFRKGIEDKYNLTWIFMKTMSKSAAAERAIRTIKTHMSMGLKAKQLLKPNKKIRRFNWTEMLPKFLAHFNSQPSPGTNVPRDEVNKMNYVKVLDSRLGLDSTAVQNTLVHPPEVLGSPRNIKKVFKFEVGDTVLLELGADFERTRSETDTRKLKKSFFEKRSQIGSFGQKPVKVTQRMLKSTKDLALIPVYRLEGYGKVWFYERQLVKVLHS